MYNEDSLPFITANGVEPAHPDSAEVSGSPPPPAEDAEASEEEIVFETAKAILPEAEAEAVVADVKEEDDQHHHHYDITKGNNDDDDVTREEDIPVITNGFHEDEEEAVVDDEITSSNGPTSVPPPPPPPPLLPPPTRLAKAAPPPPPLPQPQFLPCSMPERAKGLKNLGNTCFMNSIVQCLAHTRAIYDLFCSGDDDSLWDREDAKITRSFVRLIKDMWSGNGHPVGDPGSFKREMGGFANRFRGFEQHDSQEFLQYALEGIHTELNRAKPKKIKKERKKPAEAREINNNEVISNGDAADEDDHATNGNSDEPDPDDPEEPGICAAEAGRRCWRRYLSRDDSLVTDLFLGQFRYANSAAANTFYSSHLYP